MTPLGLFYGFAAALGAIVGSFANVCIHRLPRGESVVSPPSRCPACGARISFYDNVPVVSWLLLKGRCRSCSARIPTRYPLVEGATSLIFLYAAMTWGPGLDALRGALLGAAAVILVATDLAERILPDEVTLGGLALGLGLALLDDLTSRSVSLGGSRLVDALLGAAVGGGLLFAVRAAYLKWRRVEGLGLGDVKMLAMIGAFTGPAGVFLVLFVGSLAGSALGVSAAALRNAVWWTLSRRVASDPGRAVGVARERGLLVGADGRVLGAGPPWSAIPGAAPEGELLASSSRTARPVAAIARLMRRRGSSKGTVRTGRIVVDDGEDFFRVYAAQAVPSGGGCLVLLDRADIPFGVFLALGAVVSFAVGRSLLVLAGLPVPAPTGLLP